MEETKSLICTRCGSQHLEKQSETEYKCLSCDAIITKEKAVNFEKEYRKLLEEGKSVDIKNLRNLMDKALEGHIDKVLLVDTCTELLRILPEDVKATFYLKYVNREKDPFAYESFLESLINEATITEMDEIIDIIISSTKKREEEIIRRLANYFYGIKYNKDIDKALLRRQEEIELFSDIPRDIFICHSSLDKNKVNEILKTLEEDGNTCWISSRNIPWDSDNYWDNITKAIKSCNIFLCLNSINTMQSNDCRREVEIASDLDKKKRIEYKLDESKDITLFKAFFTGQWITNINDLLVKVYDLKHKEAKLKKEAKKLLESKEYEKAKEAFLEVKKTSEDLEIDKFIEICELIINAKILMRSNMYEEAKTKLLQINDVYYIKDLLEECNANIKVTPEVVDTKKDVLRKAVFLLNQTKDYQEAEKILFEEIAYNENSFELWYYYLYAITKGLKENNHKNVPIAFENLKRLVPNERKKDIQDLDNRLNPITINKLLEEKNKKINQFKAKNTITFGYYPQTIKKSSVRIISKTPDADGYYKGSDKEKYALVKAKPYHFALEGAQRRFSSGELIKDNKEYYFKVEPIKWKVLDVIDDKALIFSDKILDTMVFDLKTNNYEEASVRKYLNNDFYKNALPEKNRMLVQDVKLDNFKETDKIFLLSEDDVKNQKLGFASDGKSLDSFRCKKTTDYAKAKGVCALEEGRYFLRTNYDAFTGRTYYHVCCVDRRGDVKCVTPNDDGTGIVPALYRLI